MDEEGVFSILRGEEGWNEEYSSISEFKHNLKEASLAEEEVKERSWVLRYEYDSNNTKIITLLKHILSDFWFWYGRCLVQYWAVVKVEGPHHYLSTSHQPFCVGRLSKGVSWYRNLSSQYEYHVDVEGSEAEQEQLGGVGRAYRNRRPESTPNLRLYSTNEFPLCDDAARCGFRGYLALPLFDLHQNQCYGVLELLSHDPAMDEILRILNWGLKMAELRSTHVNFTPINHYEMPHKYEKPPAPAESEIREILEVAIKQVPRLSLAQVWVPCKQCANMSTNLFCMERASFVHHRNKMINICTRTDNHMLSYLQACEFQNLQIDLNCLHPNLCDLTISKNPLAHYAVRARLSHCFTICLQSVSNSDDLYVIQIFLQPKCREDACGDSSLHLLLRIIEMQLRRFIFLAKEQLLEELLVQSRQPNAIEWVSVDQLNVMNSFNEEISESNFTAYLETGDLCCLRPSSEYREERWVFCGPVEEKLVENDVKSNSLLLPILIKEKIEDFMKKISLKIWRSYWIVQFWVPKLAEDRCYLETSNQPYVVGCLAKGLASFRKVCIKHHYFVDDETKEEELGPPGRVFRNGHPEITPNLFLYSSKEFSMRNYAVHCGLEGYCAFPVFEKLKSKCVGVLEFVGLIYYNDLPLGGIGRALKAAKLHSIHSNFRPQFIAKQKPANIINCRKEALGEVRDAFDLIKKIPHLHMAKVWVPYDRCASVNGYSKCMELALTTKDIWKYMPTNEVHWIHVQPKKGIIGMRTERGKRKTSLHLSLDVLKPHYGKKLKDVAEELGVGRSTIKRACREHGIGRWPGNKKQARNPSLFERESVQDPHQLEMRPSSSSSSRNPSLHQNVSHANMESTQHLSVEEAAEKAIIRVKYEEDTIKFELCLSLEVSKIFEEVVRRLNLKMDSFKLKYVDEDNEEILLSCDDDLQLCPKSQTATGKTCIQLFVPK
ncbi:hypothetical protein C2S51_027958 [Perilla frutescens var. frutescens]|nr:hypothetical protein C2S51_027958 [Perilla frutescens var. frutescens]